MTQTEDVADLANKFLGTVQRQKQELAERLATAEEENRQLKESAKRQCDEHRIDLVAKDREHAQEMSKVLGQNFQLTLQAEQALVERKEAVEDAAELRSEARNLRAQHEQDTNEKEKLAQEVIMLRSERDATTYQLLNILAQKDEDVVLIPTYKICPQCGSNQTQYTEQRHYCRDCEDYYVPRYS